MQTALRYGRAGEIRVDLSSTDVLLDRRRPPGEPLGDVAAATAAALADPLEFPPLARALTPDDHVAIAVAAGVPQAAAVVAGVALALRDAGIDPLNILIVQTAAAADCDLAGELPDELRTSVRVFVHHRGDREQLTYLAASDDDHAIYFNRQLCDADVVIAIGCLRAAGGLGYSGASAGLYPAFADEAAQRRFNAPSFAGDKARLRHDREAEQATWQLGAMLTVQVLPGGGDAVLQVLAGERHAVDRRGQALCRQTWSFDVPQPASLVIATVEGGPGQQTWDNFARALAAAAHAAGDDGAIALCTELSVPPGPALARLAGDPTGDSVIRKICKESSLDARAAAELWRVLGGHRVYLLSQLDEDVVESLGMAYVAGGAEIARLCARHDSCIFLGNAQYAVPRKA